MRALVYAHAKTIHQLTAEPTRHKRQHQTGHLVNGITQQFRAAFHAVPPWPLNCNFRAFRRLDRYGNTLETQRSRPGASLRMRARQADNIARVTTTARKGKRAT